MNNLKELKIWNKAIDLTVDVYKATSSFPSDERFGLISQSRRSAVSIPSNIAEGAGRKGLRDTANFYSIAKGSLYESVNIIILLEKLSLIDLKKFDLKFVYSEAEEIVKMLYVMSK